MFFGAHISAAGGIDKIPERAEAIGAECVQFFLNSPYGGKRVAPIEELGESYKANAKKYKIKSSWVHSAYFINLASQNNRVYHGSISAIRKDLEGASVIGADGVIMHIGSAKDFPKDEYSAALEKAAKGLEKIFEGYEASAELILEISAGAGQIIGSKLEEIAKFLKGNVRIGGFCLDTAHAFESGWKIRSAEEVKGLLDEVDKLIGLEKLKLIHCNDSKTPFESRKDRHEHLGKGEIGMEVFEALVRDERLANMHYVLETPTEEGIVEDLAILKKMRNLEFKI